MDSLRFCQKTKGLKIYAWVIMTNHIHMIISNDKEKLSDIIRDFKKYTSSQIFKAIEKNEKESRKRWLLWLLKK
ncbi:MAG: transposase, partial [Bacteroidota bacterium]